MIKSNKSCASSLTGGRSQARFEQFGKNRDEAQFLGTLYTGMDLAANLEAARASVHEALAVYGVSGEKRRTARSSMRTLANPRRPKS